jgi:hypothetical protein
LAQRIPARLSEPKADAARAGRRFGFTLGAAFIAIASIIAWRGGELTGAQVIALPGVMLIVGALVVPARMMAVERLWMRLALLLSRITTPVFMGVVYFFVLTPTGLLRRAFSRFTPMNRERSGKTLWVTSDVNLPANLRRQF